MKIKAYLPKIAIFTFCAWIIAQIVTLCFYWNTPQFSDAAVYDNLAKYCYDNHFFYPDSSQFFTNYIIYPGYINYLILHLKVFGSLAYAGIFNVIFNVIIVLEIFALVRYFINRQAALIAVILYCILPSNTLMPQVHLTEIPFMAAVLGAICLVRRDKTVSLIFAGLLFFIANWMRPLTPIFLLPVLLYMLFHKFAYKNYLSLLLPFFAAIILTGVYTKINSGHFIFQASTGSINLIQGASDQANGGYQHECFKEGNIGYIENIEQLDFKERNSIWMARSIQWIKEHPVKYVSMIPLKIARTWWGDDYLDSFLDGSAAFYITNPTFSQKIQRIFSGILFSSTYYIVMICFIISLFRLRKEWNKDMLLLLIPLILGSGMQALLYGTQRYHYPYMPVVLLFAAWWIDKLTKKGGC
ncbi:MAG: glycosyltransferase family 39 protein [Tannerellaceae bacterium]|jgi:hypothetical protein|nr:glycosyltransferase family 39 protein [Tannerellaceae bacterium]